MARIRQVTPSASEERREKIEEFRRLFAKAKSFPFIFPDGTYRLLKKELKMSLPLQGKAEGLKT